MPLRVLSNPVVKVHLIMPEGHKQDFNDVLQQQGHQTLKNQVNKLITPQEFKTLEERLLKAHASANGKIDISKAVSAMRINNASNDIFGDKLSNVEQQAAKHAQSQDGKCAGYSNVLVVF